jgi:hypothetical protein
MNPVRGALEKRAHRGGVRVAMERETAGHCVELALECGGERTRVGLEERHVAAAACAGLRREFVTPFEGHTSSLGPGSSPTLALTPALRVGRWQETGRGHNAVMAEAPTRCQLKAPPASSVRRVTMLALIAIVLAALGCCGTLIATWYLIGLLRTELAGRSDGVVFRFLERKLRVRNRKPAARFDLGRKAYQ